MSSSDATIATPGASGAAAQKRSVLFVDDEECILQGLVRGFFRWRNDWQVWTATSGERALDLLRTHRVDVVVTDMRMPGMDGAELLARVQARLPSVVRIVLSGQADRESASRVIRSAHQCLHKPCNPQALEAILTRSLDLRDELADGAVRAAVGGVTRLPGRRDIVRRLQEAVGEDANGAREIAAIVEEDVGVTAKLLQSANSAFFGLGRQVSRAEEAVAYLGFEVVRSLVQAEIVYSSLPTSLAVERVHQRSTRIAILAHALAPPAMAHAAFSAGLLHDIGRLLLAEVPSSSEATPTFCAHVGAYLLQLWGLPWNIIEAVALQPTWQSNLSPELTLADLVGWAGALLGPEAQSLATCPRLHRLALEGELAKWREQANRLRGVGT